MNIEVSARKSLHIIVDLWDLQYQLNIPYSSRFNRFGTEMRSFLSFLRLLFVINIFEIEIHYMRRMVFTIFLM